MTAVPLPSPARPVTPEGLPVPAAQLLSLEEQVVRYRCFCGTERRTDPATWESGIKACACHGHRVPYPRRDLTGRTFGRLTPLSWQGKPSGKSSEDHHWLCRCDCGAVKTLRAMSLENGGVKSCGCLRQETAAGSARDIRGMRFGRLTALERIERPQGLSGRASHWRCQCDCGGTTDVSLAWLRSGHVKSCGCLREMGIDITGLSFRHWTAIAPTVRRNQRRQVYWQCECRCGRKMEITADRLRTTPPPCPCAPHRPALPGMRIGRLTALEKAEVPSFANKRHLEWQCQCDCGQTTSCRDEQLFENSSLYSCGCTCQWIPHAVLPSAVRGGEDDSTGISGTTARGRRVPVEPAKTYWGARIPVQGNLFQPEEEAMKAQGIIAEVVAAIDSAVAKLKAGEHLTFVTVDGEETRFTRYELRSPDSLTLRYSYDGGGYGVEANAGAGREYATTITSYDGPIRVTAARISGRDEDDESYSLQLSPRR